MKVCVRMILPPLHSQTAGQQQDQTEGHQAGHTFPQELSNLHKLPLGLLPGLWMRTLMRFCLTPSVLNWITSCSLMMTPVDKTEHPRQRRRLILELPLLIQPAPPNSNFFGTSALKHEQTSLYTSPGSWGTSSCLSRTDAGQIEQMICIAYSKTSEQNAGTGHSQNSSIGDSPPPMSPGSQETHQTLCLGLTSRPSCNAKANVSSREGKGPSPWVLTFPFLRHQGSSFQDTKLDSNPLHLSEVRTARRFLVSFSHFFLAKSIHLPKWLSFWLKKQNTAWLRFLDALGQQ